MSVGSVGDGHKSRCCETIELNGEANDILFYGEMNCGVCDFSASHFSTAIMSSCINYCDEETTCYLTRICCVQESSKLATDNIVYIFNVRSKSYVRISSAFNGWQIK